VFDDYIYVLNTLKGNCLCDLAIRKTRESHGGEVFGVDEIGGDIACVIYWLGYRNGCLNAVVAAVHFRLRKKS
jgi:hypothetical protein